MLTFEQLSCTAHSQPMPDRVSTGFADLDQVTGGARAGEIWLVVGTPGHEVSTLLTQWADRWSARRDWDTWLISPREDTSVCTYRLQASLGLVPRQPPRTAPLRVRPRETAASPHSVLQLMSQRPTAVVVDDADWFGAAEVRACLRELAARGALVVAGLRRDAVAAPATHEPDIDPEWARDADVILEVRGRGVEHATQRPGEAELTLLRNRRGPAASSVVAFQSDYDAS